VLNGAIAAVAIVQHGHHDDRNFGQRGIVAHDIENVVAGKIGHHHVEGHEDRALFADQGQRLLATARLNDVEPHAAQHECDELTGIRVVVDDEHCRRERVRRSQAIPVHRRHASGRGRVGTRRDR